MLDAVRGYVQLATGLTEVTLRKARDVAQSLLAGDLDGAIPDKDTAAGAARVVSSQVQDLADDIVAQATANRELLTGLIRTEVDRTAGRLGFVREEELAALRRHVERLEGQVRDLGAGTTSRSAPTRASTPPKKAAPKKKVPVGTSRAAKAPSAAPAAPTPSAPAADGP